ncbi:putative nuclease HARBI1 isoform X2 [Rhagoletis pomonella]|uniref:putative nuclease HARBI1 isoform X2 n=1 Tax=Rhagoletis pomonella TaxID=28610 RepID=UPI00177BBABE|nr:putative nuclease HARBI1 isoform X2 [Rhagoletis pomonella]
MSALIAFATIFMETEEHAEEALNRRILRNHSNPLEVPESVVNKDAFIMLLNVVDPHIKGTSIPTQLQLAATLRFLAEGGFQKAVGKDSYIAMGRSTVAKVTKRLLKILERYFCPHWIKLNMTENELAKSKQHFQQKFVIPDVIGCIDGTHIQITKPHKDHSLFYNRKGYFSINAMIICDYNMVIKAVDARRPGSSHDALIWSVSRAQDYFQRRYENGDRGSWLLGDAGYALQPYLLTPYRDPHVGTVHHTFNQKHSSARNVVERTIGVLKSRFRCLARCLQYQPQKVVQITNVCCALHNVCKHYKVQELIEFDIEDD